MTKAVRNVDPVLLVAFSAVADMSVGWAVGVSARQVGDEDIRTVQTCVFKAPKPVIMHAAGAEEATM
jgi:hypothetical protein